mgnify:CR=1 FL=1
MWWEVVAGISGWVGTGGQTWYIVIDFFFSSRRRHTRLRRDWSSDVCSSDLGAGDPPTDNGWWVACNVITYVSIPCQGDLNGDGVIDVSDLLKLIAAWGPCP